MRADELKTDMLVKTPMSFSGDIPSNGFSYVANGAERFFTVSQSGRDGSLVVAEFEAN